MEDDVIVISQEDIPLSDRQFKKSLTDLGYSDHTVEELLFLYKKDNSPQNTIPELILRDIIKWNYGRSDNVQYIIPIIKASSLAIVNYKSVMHYRRGGAQAKAREEVSLTVRFDVPVLCFIEGMKQFYVAPENSSVEIIGLIFAPFCAGGSTSRLMDVGIYHTRDKFLSCDDETKDFFKKTQERNLPNGPWYFGRNFLDELSIFLKWLERQQQYINSSLGQSFLAWKCSSETKPEVVKPAAEEPKPELPKTMIGAEIVRYLREKGLFEYPNSYNIEQQQNALLSIIYRLGLGKIYETAVYSGLTSEQVQEQLTAFFQAQKLKEDIRVHEAERARDRVKIGLATMLAPETEDWIKNNPAATYEQFLEQLSPLQRKKVNRAIRDWEDRSADFLNNSCKHIKLYYKLRGTGEGYNELRQYFVEPIPTDKDIECVTCHQPIMCPHLVVIYSNTTQRGLNLKAIRAGLEKFVDGKLEGRISSYFCRLCGEKLSLEMDEEHEEYVDDELRSFIWSEAAILTRHLRYDNKSLQETFGEQLAQFISQVRNVIYPYISAYEDEIYKSRTSTADEIRSKRRLFTGIYIFAYFAILVESDHYSFSELKMLPKKRDEKVIEIIKFCINKIINIYNSILITLPDITPEDIKINIIAAYKNLVEAPGIEKKMDVVIGFDGIDAEVFRANDYLYNYFKFISEFSRSGPSLPADIVVNPTIKKNEKLPAKVDMDLSKSFLKPWPYLEYVIKMSSKVASAIPKDTLSDQAQRAYIYASFLDFVGRTLPQTLTGPVMSRDRFEKWTDIVRQEKIASQLHTYKFLLPTQTRLFKPRPVPLGRIYDEHGLPHKFNIFVLANKKEVLESQYTLTPVTLGELISGEQAVVDKKCSVCGLLKSRAADLDDEKILRAISQNNMLDNFFRFYELRCPKGELHSIEDGICSKCGFAQKYIEEAKSQKLSGPGRSYFTSFIDTYKKEQSILHTVVSEDMGHRTQAAESEVSETPQRIVKALAAWTFNSDLIADLAKKLDIDTYWIENMGLYEGLKETDIKNIQNTYSANTVDDYRIYMLRSRIIDFVSQYNQIRFYHKITYPPAHITEIIENSGIGRHDLPSLERELEDIYDNFNEKFAQLRLERDAVRLLQFLLWTLCEKALRVWNANAPTTKKLRRDLVRIFFANAIQAERLLTKQNYFNWSTAFGEGVSTYDMNITRDDDEDDEGGETLDGEGDEVAEISTAAPLENNFDIDAEGEELEDQQWDVGEEYGLD